MSIKRRINSNSYKISKKTKKNKVANVPKKEYVIYCRVSTKEQSLDSQEHSCIKFCEENGFNVIDIVRESCSARTLDSQKKLKELICENTDITIIVNSVDRFSRNVVECSKMFDIMKQNNINLISVTDHIDLNSAYGEHAFRTRVSTAQLESDTISERVRRTIDYKIANGLALSSRTRYGYKIVDRRVQPDLKEQAVIKFILKFYAATSTSKYFSEELYKLLDLFNKPDDFYVPVIFEENNKKVHSMQITSKVLANILNEYEIFRRDKYWTSQSINKVSVLTFEEKFSLGLYL